MQRSVRCGAPFSLRLAACALGVFGLEASAAGSPSQPLPGQLDLSSNLPLLQLTKPAGGPLVMAWRARVAVAGAEFRVYRGYDAMHLQRVMDLPADRGERGYRVRDTGSSAEDAFYELRLADPDGREQVLARAFCVRTANLGKSTTAPTPRTPQPALCAGGVCEDTPSVSLCALPPVSLIFQSRPQPLHPPPRVPAV